jgi:hypothetical protein
MKKTFLLLAGITSMLGYSTAAVLTVSNNPASPGQYTDFQLAINASSAGDTIYLQGSPNYYGNSTTYKVDRTLTIIGSGYDVTNTDYKYNTTIYGYIRLDSTINNIVEGIKFVGIRFYNYNISTDNTGTGTGLIQNNVTFDRCLFDYSTIYISGHNWTIKNCLFNYYSSIYVNNQNNQYTNVTISNNIFYYNYSPSIYNSNSPSVFVMNNLFVNCSNDFSTVSYANVYNNIFYASGAGSGTNCIYNNNLTFNTSLISLPGANNSGTGNQNQKDPKFVSSASIPAPGSFPNGNWGIFKTFDWHLQASSPGHNAGSDETDMGLYGGTYPWVNFSGASSLPLIQSFFIKNPVVQQNGTINVTVKAKKQQ